MRRTSLSPEQASELGRVLLYRRQELGWSFRELEAQSGIIMATIQRLEHGEIFRPQPDTIIRMAKALDLTATDLFTTAGWLPPGELPGLRPYLRAKYHELDEQAIADLERYAARLAKRSGTAGPRDYEDENENPERTNH